MKYVQWLDNEYRLWVEALKSSSVYNFKDHPQVKRMLSEDLVWSGTVPRVDMVLMEKINQIGYSKPTPINGACLRMIYYANTIFHINPPSIIEIGGGAGQFYAILRAMGYEGDYFIQDIPDVMLFQNSYLRAVHNATRLCTSQSLHFDFCVSFHALGEFDDETKEYYENVVVSKCPHGYIVWNPHSGATEGIPFKFKYEVIQQKDGSKVITW